MSLSEIIPTIVAGVLYIGAGIAAIRLMLALTRGAGSTIVKFGVPGIVAAAFFGLGFLEGVETAVVPVPWLAGFLAEAFLGDTFPLVINVISLAVCTVLVSRLFRRNKDGAGSDYEPPKSDQWP